MVAPTHGLPLIQNGRGVSVPFENDWLRAALDKAATKAGYENWSLLDEFSAVLSWYFRYSYRPKVIGLRRLERLVRSTLRDVGYHEIASRFRAMDPVQSVSLAECLKHSSTSDQPLFFKRLAARIGTLHEAKVQYFHFYDLRFCIQKLAEKNQALCCWDDPMLRGRIVSFVRDRMQSLSWNRKVQCSIS